jgi:uncharacterized protein YkwD
MAASGRRAWNAAIVSTCGVVGTLLLSQPVFGWWGSAATDRAEPLLCIPGADWGTNQPAAAARVLALINAVRTENGLSELAPNPALGASATWKSLHMGRFGYFGHEDPAPPVDRSPFERAVACGYGNSYIGEDIAAGQSSPDEAVRDWLASPRHRAIIESSAYSEAGVGVAQSPEGRLYWTLDVGRGPM